MHTSTQTHTEHLHAWTHTGKHTQGFKPTTSSTLTTEPPPLTDRCSQPAGVGVGLLSKQGFKLTTLTQGPHCSLTVVHDLQAMGAQGLQLRQQMVHAALLLLQVLQLVLQLLLLQAQCQPRTCTPSRVAAATAVGVVAWSALSLQYAVLVQSSCSVV